MLARASTEVGDNFQGRVCARYDACVQVFRDPAIRRAKSAIAKAQAFTPRDKLFIRLREVELIMKWALDAGEHLRVAMLFLMSYIFLLRVPSEALPAMAGRGEGQSRLYKEGDKIVLRLARRCARALAPFNVGVSVCSILCNWKEK